MNKVFKYVLVVFIAILFTGIVFYGANTIFKTETNDCWQKYTIPSPKDGNYSDPAYLAASERVNQQQMACDKLYTETTRKSNQSKQIFIGILSILIIALIFFLKEDFVNLGLVSGVIITNFISTIAYYDTNSVISFALLIVIFIGVLVFIVKRTNLKED